MGQLANKLLKEEPLYGSRQWWDKETQEALEEVKKGNVVSFDNVEDLIADLHS